MEISRTPMKSIRIDRVVYLHNAGTTDEKRETAYLVTVDVFDAQGQHVDSTQQPYSTSEEAQAYAADLATRDLRTFDLATILEPR